ncbi:MAG: acetyl-CoA C-acyltransferase [Flavobacteriales bacterium]|jgi:acetyl-CoA C-acetyltransferase|nr:acetyl-CoA C-acyltransferase [Flavobacteriales bacterium]|tara:strand:- start:247 stop:1425 length:1179 start_codon:yes stop_codon:yes gene_type:complete
MKEVVIVSYARTPIGSFGGSLSSVNATKLGSIAIKGAIKKINLDPNNVNEVYMGNVISAGLGQAPAKQAAIFAGISNQTPCTTINKVCSSGMKAIMIGAQSIQSGENEIVIAGGMENMSSIPFYLKDMRSGKKLGHTQINDGLLIDGLTDVYDSVHMGVCAEICAEEMDISRDEQDEFALKSYEKSKKAWENRFFSNEIEPVTITTRKGDITIDTDEEFSNINIEKFKKLRPVFKKDGTVTAGNASTINDGAAALVLMSQEKAHELNLKPIAKIISFADSSQEPKWFTTAPTKALEKALNKANLNKDSVDFWELNEAFSVVGIANIKNLGIDNKKVNVNGGAVSLGHPLGCSGARILVTLLSTLEKNNKRIGAAGICNGGGGASAMIIKNLC